MIDPTVWLSGRLPRPWDIAAGLATALVCCLQAWLFWYAHAHHYLGHPTSAVLGDGWWGWPDQGHYLAAAAALADGDLSAAHYWYEPGYSVLAAPFLRFASADPFFIPDAGCYILCGWLSARLGSALLGGPAWAGPLAALCFVGTTAWRPAMLEIWVVPWTTTATTPLFMGALVAAIGFAARPRPATCFLAALLACATALVRPSDLPVIAGPVGVFLLATLARPRMAGRRLGLAAWAVLGGALPLAAALALHAAIWGPHLGPYLDQSRQIGFEWALIPLRWVLILCGPRPLLTDGAGLAQVFPWIVTGIAGAVAAVLSPGRAGRAIHALVIATVAGQVLLMLAYRDLHPTGLWRFRNYHYFKFAIPALGLYSLVLLQILAQRRRRAAALPGLAVAAGLFLWRPELDRDAGSMAAQVTGPHDLSVTNSRQGIADGVLVAARGSWFGTVMAQHGGRAGQVALSVNTDFKAYVQPGGLLLIPLRPLPRQFTVDFDPDVTFADDAVAIPVRQHLVFGLPCWGWRCTPSVSLPAQKLPLGRRVAFDAAAEPYAAGGWFYGEPSGRWTNGAASWLRVSLPEATASRVLTLRLQGFGRPSVGGDMARIDVTANGHALGTWQPNGGPGQRFSAPFPADRLSPDRELVIGLHVHNPRSPEPGVDPRVLGVYLQFFEVDDG